MYLQRVRVAGRSCAPGAPPLTHVSTALHTPVAQNLGVGLRRPCWGQTCGGMHGAMAWIAAARPATPLNGPTAKFLRSRSVFMINVAKSAREIGEGGGGHAPRTQAVRRTNFLFNTRTNNSESPVCSGFYSKLRAQHRGTSLGSCVCGANKKGWSWRLGTCVRLSSFFSR
jgi:hypothetical protein